MTRDEAINRILGIERSTPIHTRDDARDFEALEMAIEALKQEPCEDAISRQEALKLFATHDGHYLYEAIRDLPSVTPKQETGRWIDTDEGFSPCECSECESVEFRKSKYCPNCGAKMESEEQA